MHHKASQKGRIFTHGATTKEEEKVYATNLTSLITIFKMLQILP